MEHSLTQLSSLSSSMMSEADQIEYAIKMSLQQHGTASDAETPNIDSSRETTPMNTDITNMVRLKLKTRFQTVLFIPWLSIVFF